MVKRTRHAILVQTVLGVSIRTSVMRSSLAATLSTYVKEIMKKEGDQVLENVTSIKDFSQGKLVALYGKSGSGKTTLGATFPKPMLYVKIGDDGSSVIKDVDGIDAVEISKVSEINVLIKELERTTNTNQCSLTRSLLL